MFSFFRSNEEHPACRVSSQANGNWILFPYVKCTFDRSATAPRIPGKWPSGKKHHPLAHVESGTAIVTPHTDGKWYIRRLLNTRTPRYYSFPFFYFYPPRFPTVQQRGLSPPFALPALRGTLIFSHELFLFCFCSARGMTFSFRRDTGTQLSRLLFF